MLTVNEKLEALRAQMKTQAIDACYIGTADPHDSEYVAPYYQARAWLTGFTGSAGTAVVTADQALLWADGRYYIQAQGQLLGSDFVLMKQGSPGVPKPEAWLAENLVPGSLLWVDGRLLSEALARRMEKALAEKEIQLVTQGDLVGPIWQDRPAPPSGAVFSHEIQFTGRSAADKIREVRSRMEADGADYALYVGLDDIAWLMNFRGSDVPNNTVALAFALIDRESARLFIDLDKVDEAMMGFFEKEKIQLFPYEAITDQLGLLAEGRLVTNLERASRALVAALPAGVSLLDKADYPYHMKAVLNDVELLSQFRAGLRDSLAVTRYLYYVKHVAAPQGLNELEVKDRLREIRAQSPDFIIESFPTISAYGANAAMMHYQATPEAFSRLETRGFYLVDCGAQSYDGTTDITRTISLGPLTELEKKDYTMTLKSHIQLASQPFLEGTSGVALDAIARSAMWRYGLDYKCGTGHGFGYLSGVHEGPQRLTHSPLHGQFGFRPHIVITIEPGVYREGLHGIRLENDYVVLRANRRALVKGQCLEFEDQEEVLNEAGDRFLHFQTMTFVPFDRSAILVSMLTDQERHWLNDYHEEVRKALTPYLEGEELAFVLEETQAL